MNSQQPPPWSSSGPNPSDHDSTQSSPWGEWNPNVPPWQGRPGDQQPGGPGPWQQPQYRPPVIPFRPLNLGELFEGTFAAIRSNPKVMFTVSITVMVIVGILGAAINGVVINAWGGWELTSAYLSDPDLYELLSEYESLYQVSLAQLGLSLLQSVAALFVTGVLALSVTNAVVAVNLDLSQTWQQLRPRFGRMILTAILVWLIMVGFGLAALAVVAVPFIFASLVTPLWGILIFVGILLLIAVIPFVIWVGLRLSFATMIVVVEDTPVMMAVRRSWDLTRGAVWRLLGRYLLLGIIMGIVMSLLGGVISVATVLITSFAPAWVGIVVTTVLLAALSGLAQPVSAAYSTLMYVDERMRSENLGPVLYSSLQQNQAGR